MSICLGWFPAGALPALDFFSEGGGPNASPVAFTYSCFNSSSSWVGWVVYTITVGTCEHARQGGICQKTGTTNERGLKKDAARQLSHEQVDWATGPLSRRDDRSLYIYKLRSSVPVDLVLKASCMAPVDMCRVRGQHTCTCTMTWPWSTWTYMKVLAGALPYCCYPTVVLVAKLTCSAVDYYLQAQELCCAVHVETSSSINSTAVDRLNGDQTLVAFAACGEKACAAACARACATQPACCTPGTTRSTIEHEPSPTAPDAASMHAYLDVRLHVILGGAPSLEVSDGVTLGLDGSTDLQALC